MSGETEVINYARLYGMIPFPNVVYFYGEDYGKNRRYIFAQEPPDSDRDAPITLEDGSLLQCTPEEYAAIRDKTVAAISQDEWYSLYDHDLEYDVFACWYYLGENPLSPGVGMQEDAFVDGFDDALD